MGQNFQLEYGGFTPAQAVLGHNPRRIYETATSSTLAHHGALETSPDYFESCIRLRNIARACIQQAIIEARIAIANSLTSHENGPLQTQSHRQRDVPTIGGVQGQSNDLLETHRGPRESIERSSQVGTPSRWEPNRKNGGRSL